MFFVWFYNQLSDCDFVTFDFSPFQIVTLSALLLSRILLELLLEPPAETEPLRLCQHLRHSSLGLLTRYIFRLLC